MLNVTIHCTFSKESYGTLNSSFDITWMALQGVLNSVSTFMLGLGGVEFICAQTPYSMRGLISGAGYGSVALFTLAGIAITQPFMMDLSIWKTGGIINCGFCSSLSSSYSMVLYSIFWEEFTRTEKEKMCYQMNRSLPRDTTLNNKKNHIVP